jgi:deazaflavin-dependent oxidoreductase (nitroreductase family)
MRVTTIGRVSGQERSVMLAYITDGPNLHTMAMNGWDAPDPAWWLNLQAHPEAHIQLIDGPLDVVARAAEGEERSRLWQAWEEIDDDLAAFASLRPTETAVVVFEPVHAD